MTFGKPFGQGPHFITDDGRFVTMWRKGCRVRFYTDDGEQVGPEQRNVAPAIAFAHHYHWTPLS